ncbi:MAG: methyltransferase, partial [Sphingomonas bacterium]|uniref:type ISP restriction/modification enzyme n=1 Tax=Sphingomonas bacterium TaxID=1895847 RepID=UPI00261DBA51
ISNVFGIGTGVAIAFLVRKKGRAGIAHLEITMAPDVDADGKLSWLNDLSLGQIKSTTVKPSADGAWLDDAQPYPSRYLPIATKATKLGTRGQGSIFHLFSLGVVTNRDDWVYDQDPVRLNAKVDYLLDDYGKAIRDSKPWHKNDAEEVRFRSGIKWTRALKALARRRVAVTAPPSRESMYRPFTKLWLAYSPQLNEMPYLNDQIFPFSGSSENLSIDFTGPDSQKPWMTLATGMVCDLHLVGSGAGTVELPRYRYTKTGERIDNITDWALNKFVARYGKKGVTKDAIFHYVYAVLHDPVYRETYALNLKREFPRIPFYPDFAQWVGWGSTLMAMHIGYEEVTPWPVERVDTPAKRAEGTHPKPILRSQPEQGVVVVDADTQITGIPPQAWTYRLGNRSAIDWVLDQHKEKKPRDPTIAAKFNTYRFADYKESMIALLAKVVRVSVETVAITDAMRTVERGADEQA